MSEVISPELLLAILSMDAYNRGYGAGIALPGNQVGNATILKDSEEVLREAGQEEGERSPAFDAGFYALAYTVGEGVEGIAPGTTVISYRGTDNPSPNADPYKGGSDITNGWVLGEGTLNAQSRLAQAFYAQVNPDIVTGHSLGGGLAGTSGIPARRARACP